MRRLRRQLTYANVISTVCLFLLLGGAGAYAATQMLPKNSVGTKQLRSHAVTISKLSKVAIKKLHGAAGAPQGIKGDQGPAGPSNTYIDGSAGAKLAKANKEIVSIAVPAGSFLIGAKTAVLTNSADEAGDGFCALSTGQGSIEGSDGYEFALLPIAGENSSTDVSLASAVTLTTPQSIALSCDASKGSLLAEDARVWAIEVGSLQGLPVPTD